MRYLAKPEILDGLPTFGHCVIEASAGTGKTYTIEHLFLDLLLKGRPIEEILVVTFTRKATGELRERLASIIERVLTETETKVPEGPHWSIDGEAIKRMRLAKRDFYKATISTLDSMTQRISGDNYDLIALDAHAELSTEGVKAEAFDRFMREDLPNDPLLIDMLYAFKTLDDAMSDTLSLGDRHRNASSLRKTLQSMASQPFDEVDVGSVLRGDARAVKKNLFSYRKQFGLLLELIREMELDELARKILEIRQKWSGSKRSKSSGLKDEAVFLDFLKHADKRHWVLAASYFTALLKVWKMDAPDSFDSEFEAHWGYLYAHAFWPDELVVRYALPRYLAQIDACKKSLGVYDYDDYTRGLAEALKTKPQLVHRVRKSWKVAIVDEFQDTSREQWEILKHAFVDGASDSRLFVIGDPKQAIYRFRGGDIYTYREARRCIAGDDASRIVRLEHNYRSTPELIDLINGFFLSTSDESVFSADVSLFRSDPNPESSDVFYNVYERVLAGHKDWRCEDLDSGKVLSPLGLLEVDCEADGMGRSKNRLEALSQAIVDEMVCLLSSESFRVVCQSDNGPRALQKIFILSDAHKNFEYIIPKLAEAGIAFDRVRSQSNSHFNEAEIYELTWIMLAIGHPRDRSLFAAALNTSIFGFCLLDVVEELDVRQSQYFPIFATWSEMAKAREFVEIFDEILSVGRYRERLTLYAYSDEAYHNVVSVMDYLLLVASQEALDWRGLCEHLGSLRRGEQSAEVTREEGDARVSLMTIHGSKGLEADVVFLLLDWNYGEKSRRQKTCYYHRKEGETQLRVLRPENLSQGARAYDGIEDSLESERKLYVAMTRASLRLYLPFFDKEKVSQPSSIQRLLMSWSSEKRAGYRALHRLCATRRFGVKALSSEGVLEGLDAIASHRDNLERLSSKSVSRVYPNPRLISSYSSLKRERQRSESLDFSELWQRSTLVSRSSRQDVLIPGAQTGLFLHALLEEIDFSFLSEQKSKQRGLNDWLLESDDSPAAQATLQLFSKTAEAYDRVAALPKAKELVFLALTKSLGVYAPDGLCAVEAATSELEFLCSWDGESEDWPSVAEGSSFLKGFIDLLYWQGGRLYAVDWKSDALDDYRPEYLAEQVAEKYQEQVAIYTFVLRRWLAAMECDVDKAYGGMLYVYLRGLELDSDNGIYFIDS